MPYVTMGEMPSSMSVPRFDARITRIQNSGSELSLDMIPYSGICEDTRKMASTIAVHITRDWNGTVGVSTTRRVCRYAPLRSGDDTSGSTERNGRTSDKRRTAPRQPRCTPPRTPPTPTHRAWKSVRLPACEDGVGVHPRTRGVIISQPALSFFQPVVCDVPRRDEEGRDGAWRWHTRLELTPADHPGALLYVWQGDRRQVGRVPRAAHRGPHRG